MVCFAVPFQASSVVLKDTLTTAPLAFIPAKVDRCTIVTKGLPGTELAVFLVPELIVTLAFTGMGLDVSC